MVRIHLDRGMSDRDISFGKDALVPRSLKPLAFSFIERQLKVFACVGYDKNDRALSREYKGLS